MPREFTPIVVVPEAKVVARPACEGAFAMVATDASEELQCAFRVTEEIGLRYRESSGNQSTGLPPGIRDPGCR